MTPQLDSKAWAKETTLGRRIFNHNFRMLGRELKGSRLVKTVPMHQDRTLSIWVYLWQSTEAPERELVRVEVAELFDWRAAQKHLVVMLGNTMRPNLPRGTGPLAIGDICFVSRALQSDKPASVQFVRGNVAVAVNSVGAVTTDVSEVAAVVDSALAQPPATVPSLRRLAKVKLPKYVVAKGKAPVTLVKNLEAASNEWLKIIVTDGELRRRGNGIVYTSPPTGRKPVQVFSMQF